MTGMKNEALEPEIICIARRGSQDEVANRKSTWQIANLPGKSQFASRRRKSQFANLPAKSQFANRNSQIYLAPLCLTAS